MPSVKFDLYMPTSPVKVPEHFLVKVLYVKKTKRLFFTVHTTVAGERLQGDWSPESWVVMVKFQAPVLVRKNKLYYLNSITYNEKERSLRCCAVLD